MTGACAGSLPNFEKKTAGFLRNLSQHKPSPSHPVALVFPRISSWRWMVSSRPMRASWMSFGSSRNMSSPGAQRAQGQSSGTPGQGAGQPCWAFGLDLIGCLIKHRFQKQKPEQRFAHVCTMLPTWGWFIVIFVYPETGVLIWLTHVNPLYISHYFMFLFPYVHSHIFPMEPVFTIYKTTWYKKYRQI